MLLAHELEAAVCPFEAADDAKNGGGDGEDDGFAEMRGVPEGVKEGDGEDDAVKGEEGPYDYD